MANTTYGTGTALQFSDASQRQVLELGSKIHYYNPSVTPLLTLMGRMSTSVTPVPIFEWMEDEYMIKKSIVTDVDSSGTEILDTASQAGGGNNSKGAIITMTKQSSLELFEKGALYAISVTGGVSLNSMTHVMCIATGAECNVASANDKNVQFIGFDALSGGTATHDRTNSSTAIFSQSSSAGTITFTYVGNCGAFSTFNKPGSSVAEGDLADNETCSVLGLSGHAEGAAIGEQTSKKVRRLKGCTQIFREPYSITGTANAAKHYGGSELARLQARKLAKIKSDIEFAMLTNGNISLDATSENPKRTMAGFGIGGSAGTGVIKSLDGRGDANLQADFDDADMDQFDAVVEYIFSDTMEGSMEKTVLCSHKWLRFITALGRQGVGPTVHAAVAHSQAVRLNQDAGVADATTGLQVTSYQGPVGKLNFVPHPMLKGAYEDFALAVDMANVDLRPLASRDMQLRPDVVNDGRDARVDEWLMEVGMEVRNEQTHAILKLT